MNNPYTADELINHLRYFWEKAEGLDYDHEHEVMHCAADEIARLRAENDEFRRIRDLLVRALVTATGNQKMDIDEAPLTMATKHMEEVARLRAENKQLRISRDEWKRLYDEARPVQLPCPECKDGLPSMNWRDGKPYSYCPECGREEQHDPDAGPADSRGCTWHSQG